MLQSEVGLEDANGKMEEKQAKKQKNQHHPPLKEEANGNLHSALE
jgi:hypothetical protein